jgi:HD-like signal output (HDOD) protein
LLHDSGKILLNNYLPDEYKKVVECVKMQNLTIAEAERSVLGVDHAHVGSELLRLWKLPAHETRGIALHHEPSPWVSRAPPGMTSQPSFSEA